MFRTKQTTPAPGIEKHIPELKAYIRDHYYDPHKPPVMDNAVFSKEDEERWRKESEEQRRKINEIYDTPGVFEYIRQWLRDHEAKGTFCGVVTKLAEQRFGKTSDFYLPVGIDRRTYHKMKTDKEYKPSRNTALRCCIGLHLTHDQANIVLKLAGYALSTCDTSDLIISYCLDNGIWDLAGINYLLDAFDIKDLDGYTV